MNARIFAILPAAVISALVWPVAMPAQPANGVPSNAATHARTLESAVSSARTGNFTAAEAALFADNVQRPNTLAWDIEAATKLAHLALTLRQSLDSRNANTAAQRSLAQLADTNARHSSDAPAADRAQIFETAGFIYETLLFDAFSAKSAYLQAQGLNPASKPAAAGLARLQALEQIKTRVLGGRS